jgi:two-component system, LuxR family, response regulator FixJ
LNPALICIIDDDKEMLASLGDLLLSAGYVTARFESAEAFLRSPAKHQCNCIITDIEMPGMTGADLALALNSEGIETPRIAVTAHPSHRNASAAGGWLCLLTKPFKPDALLACVAQALQQRAGP